MPEPEVLIASEALIRFAQRILETLHVSEPTARLVATSLVASNLRGVDSHGIQLLPYYVEQMESGDMDRDALGRVVSEAGCCLTYDCENGIGQASAEICCDHALRIAQQHGMALVVAREANHFGAAAWWAQKISGSRNIGIVMCNASPLVPPWQGKEPRLGTNPICMSVPGPWLLDMATTTVAANKILKAMINGQPTIPAGWAMDREGVPTTDTATAFKGLPMPLGGYKGSGLAMMVEILCAVLGGGPMSTEVGGIRFRGKKVRVSYMFLAIEIERFMPAGEFTARMEWLVRTVKSAAPAAGYHEVLVAGEPEWRLEKQRLRDGVPVGAGTWKVLTGLGERLAVAVPGATEPVPERLRP
jgi:LDH2 family malate/lactate/ureidoglycolate dehydrogenase